MTDDGTPKTAESGADFVPTAEQRAEVADAVAAGLQPDQIARVLGIRPEALAWHFAAELESAAAKANYAVAAALFRHATEGKGKDANLAGIFWLKCRAGWEERHGSAAGEE